MCEIYSCSVSDSDPEPEILHYEKTFQESDRTSGGMKVLILKFHIEVGALPWSLLAKIANSKFQS